MLSVYVTPRGFPVPIKEGMDKIGEGLQVTNDLLEYLQMKPTDGVDYHFKVIDQAKALLDVNGKLSLSTWLSFISSNPTKEMGYLHYSFLLDTIGFIETGFRRVSPMTMIALLNSTPEADKKMSSHQDSLVKVKQNLNERIEKIKGTDIDRYFISHWLDHNEGLSDLVYTLQLIFGKKSV